MRGIVQTSRFKKDLKRVLKRGYAQKKLLEIVEILATGKSLPHRTVPHMLVGEYCGVMECHIAPDWLLLYEVTDTAVYLYRTGTHADLFD